MQFNKLQSFHIPQKSVRSVNSLTPTSNKKSDKLKIISMRFNSSKQNQSLFCGLSDGSVLQFTQKKYSEKRLTENKEYQTRFLNFPNAHKGEIKVLLFETIFNQSFLITGSADRTIKIWDVDVKSKDIVQTLTGHAGTILTMIYSKKTDTIFSGSTDKTIRIWKQDEGRKFFLYPWYTCYQTISQFVSKKVEHPVYPTCFDIQDGQISNFTLYMGDSAGNLHIIKEIQILNSYQEGYGKPRTAFEIDRSNYGYHRLSINNIVYVPKQHLVITSSFDQNVYVFESLSDKLLLKMFNPRKVNYTSIIWYQGMLVAADEQGTLYCKQVNSDKGVEQIRKYQTRIHQLVCQPGQIDLFVLTDDGVDAIRILKGIKAVEGENCHSQSINGMFSLEVHKLTENKIKDQAKIVTVSLDNTMRVWDPADLSCLEVLHNPEKCQISCLFYLKRANLFVTGHQDGTVRLWNIELQTSITISQSGNSHAHLNCICAFAEFIHVRSNEDVTEYMFTAGYEGKVSIWEIFIKKSQVQSSLMSSTICPQLKFSFFPNQMQQTPDKIGFELFALQVWQPHGSKSQEQVQILSAGSKGEVYFTKMFSYETYRKVKIHDDTINCMLIDQNILFTGGYDQQIKLTSLQTLEMLLCLSAHKDAIVSLSLIQETGHLLSHSSEGQMIFWDYPQSKVVKVHFNQYLQTIQKIHQKKQRILSHCYVDELQMIYMGTEDAKIISADLSVLYNNMVSRQVNIQSYQQQQQQTHEHQQSIIINNQKRKQKKSKDYTQEDLQKILKQNQQELAKLMSS